MREQSVELDADEGARLFSALDAARFDVSAETSPRLACDVGVMAQQTFGVGRSMTGVQHHHDTRASGRRG